MAAANGDIRHRKANGHLPGVTNGHPTSGKNDIAFTSAEEAKSSTTTLNLLICVGGIYASL
jgi:solute carrier family 35 (UDP-galactose transporter), member B1